MNNTPLSIHLHYREGNSDKVYQVQLEPKEDGYVVTFAYGRRGSTLQTGTKTTSPVPYDDALTIFHRLVKEKKSKGYTESESGTPYVGTENAQDDTGIRPQLLNAISETELVPYLHDVAWCLQEKFDGKRLLLWKIGDTIAGINRRGLRVGLPQSLVTEVQRIPHDLLMDGEIIGERYFAFDLVHLQGNDLRQEPYQKRLSQLQVILTALKSNRLPVIHTAFTSQEKEALFEWTKLQDREGVVCKRLDAPYQPGRPNSGGDQLKVKHLASCSVIVEKVNRQRSVSIQLWDGDKLVSAGNVTVPPNRALPKPGSIVEVRFLYAFKESGALYQPVYQYQRDDLNELDCTTEQLKYKPTDSEEE
ncbi:MAG: WGR domain-containing protein [Desulfomonile tiedjei]|uniref:WGR domain-containing protein n=1 Tax=Desulfomonile tiedjei TaxID=2358 RepID=A0A9D6V5S0_9BACT|nr:WGR domain-containing protein [Desulfomonile tiedjei]